MNPIGKIERDLLNTVAGLSGVPSDGAYNIRVNGTSAGRMNSQNIQIEPKPNGRGIDIHVAPGTKAEKVHIPVVVSANNHVEIVYNDFYIGEGAEVEIVAGCGIHNCGSGKSQHDGIHTFHLEKDSRVLYTEKHYGTGDGSGERILNPVTAVYLGESAHMEMDTVQIEGVDSTRRLAKGTVGKGATLIVREKLMTSGNQYAQTAFEVSMDGEGSSVNLISRSVAKGKSQQIFFSKIVGNNRCTGHSECDAIIMDNAVVKAIPEITATHVDASLIHEAAIGKIAGEQLIKLMTLGLTHEDAEKQIVKGFLK